MRRNYHFSLLNGSRSAKRNLRDSARSRAFDNAGSRSACATCAMDVVPTRLIMQVHALFSDRRGSDDLPLACRAARRGHSNVRSFPSLAARALFSDRRGSDDLQSFPSQSSAGFAARSTTRGDVDTFTASVERM